MKVQNAVLIFLITIAAIFCFLSLVVLGKSKNVIENYHPDFVVSLKNHSKLETYLEATEINKPLKIIFTNEEQKHMSSWSKVTSGEPIYNKGYSFSEESDFYIVSLYLNYNEYSTYGSTKIEHDLEVELVKSLLQRKYPISDNTLTFNEEFQKIIKDVNNTHSENLFKVSFKVEKQ